MFFRNNQGNDILLKDTSYGQLWLSQFAKTDRDVANLLLDSILYITNEQFITGLKDTILDFSKKHAEDKIALFVARENTGEAYWRRDSKPMSVAGRKEVGSEGILSNLCRDLSRLCGNILDHPSIKEMRDLQCRHLLFIDDMVGSGTRIVSFAKWLYENKTIKSWRSLKYIDFLACSYAGSDYGLNFVSKANIFSEIKLVQSTCSGRSIWTDSQREQIKALCQKYSIYTSRAGIPLGYKDAFTCIVFAHKCPNTNPAIIWATKTKSWQAIFQSRPEFIMNNKIIIDKKKHKQEIILKNLGHNRLLNSILFKKLNNESRQILILLSCLAARRNHVNTLSDIFELPITIIRQQIELCKKYGWIDTNKRLTDLGKRVLEIARRKKHIQEYKLAIKRDFYFPSTYR